MKYSLCNFNVKLHEVLHVILTKQFNFAMETGVHFISVSILIHVGLTIAQRNLEPLNIVSNKHIGSF